MRGRSFDMPTTSRRAFTLLEIVLVLAIMGVIAGIATPRYAAAVSRFQVNTAVRRLVRDLTTARERARSRGASQSVTFTIASDTYRIAGLQGLDGSANYVVNVAGQPYNASLVSANFSGAASVVFDGYGVPNSGGTVVLDSGGYVRTVTVDPQTGRASLQ